MIGIMEFSRGPTMFFSYEFPLESEDSIVGLSWGEGVKAAIAEFRRQFPGESLFGLAFKFDVRS